MCRIAIPLLLLSLLAFPTGTFAQDKKDWKSHPLAPSVPLLADEEYERIEKVIDQFIRYDAGMLPKATGKKVLAEFEALGPEAVFSLVDGLNRAANMQASCPAVIIAKKLNRLIKSSQDPQLLDYIRDNAGSGVTIVRHMNAIKDLRLACLLRKSTLQRSGLLAPAGKKMPRVMTIDELATAAGKEKGQYLKQVLMELDQRQGEQVIITLGMALSRPEPDIKALAQNLLLKQLNRQNPQELKALLKNNQDEVRLGVIYLIGVKKLPWGDELIDALDDPSVPVQQLARQALIQLSGGKDFGPAPTGSTSERALAISSWREWWKGQGSPSSQEK